VDELEKFFGERIIFRRKKINMKSDPRVFSILHDYQEKIVDGLKTSPKGEAFVQKYQLKPQQEIEFKSKSPLEIVEESIITVPCILSYAIKPVYPNDIRSELGVRNISEIISCLSSYGILNEENGKYYTSSIEFFEKSLKRLYRQAEKYKLYIKVQNLKKDLLFKGVVDVLGLSIPTIYSWIDGSYKPRPLPLHSVELLLRRGLISEKEFEDFKRYGLVRTVSI
jgi:hypothetical protein